MFFEETQIFEVIKCAVCLNKYDEPKILPCGYTLCKDCMNSVENSIEKNVDEFKC